MVWIGSWYTADGAELSRQLSSWLEAAAAAPCDPRIERDAKVRCVIAPHAGYSYSGPCAAHAYTHLRAAGVKRVFLLGPSHHYYLSGCALSTASVYRTPVGDLEVCSSTYAELRETGAFEEMCMSDDEAEHSMEMHAPYIAHIFAGSGAKLVPILVGALSLSNEERYGRLLAPYLHDPGSVFVISSDFCHWGRRFRYTPFHATSTPERPLFANIEALDRQGMELIEKVDARGFSRYLIDTGNTICGRHPITVCLFMLDAFDGGDHSVLFTKYEQSSPAQTIHDSSVSYASAVVMKK